MKDSSEVSRCDFNQVQALSASTSDGTVLLGVGVDEGLSGKVAFTRRKLRYGQRRVLIGSFRRPLRESYISRRANRLLHFVL